MISGCKICSGGAEVPEPAFVIRVLMSAVQCAAPTILADEQTRLQNSTVARIVAAKGELSDPAVLKECCERLLKINGLLKGRIAESDAESAHEAMKGGLTGIGCDNTKLIAALCTRTKAALGRTASAYRAKYDKDLAKEVKGLSLIHI